MFMLKMSDGSEKLYRVQKLTAGNSRITFRQHNSADIGDPVTGENKSPNTLEGHKVVVDLLGRIHPAND